MLLVLSTHAHTHTLIIKLKQEDSLNLRVTRIFSAKSSLEASQTDLCFVSTATSSFSMAHPSGVQTTMADNVHSQTISTPPIPTSFLLRSQFHLEQQYIQLNIPSRLPCS